MKNNNSQQYENSQPTNVNVEPKIIPFRCVICKGFGTVNYGQKTCSACDGKGYLLVKQEEEKHERTNTAT